jgi:hypothetical protein
MLHKTTFTAADMKFPSRLLLVLGFLAVILAPCARALPESEATAGRLLARRYVDAIVGVKGSVFMKITIGLRSIPPTERKIDVSATVISASGLTLTSLSAVDPRELFESMRGQLNTGADPLELGQTDFKNLRLRMTDGTEIPAKIVWKDSEHDLVLLSPDGAAAGNRTFSFVDLNQATDSASLLGDYFHLSRAGEAFKRVLMVRPCTVIGIVERPRRLLLVTTDMFPDALGCPIFDSEGRVLGICLNNIDKGRPSGSMVVPATDIAAAIAQASPDQAH